MFRHFYNKERCLEIFHSQFYQVSNALSSIQLLPPTLGRMDKEIRISVFSLQPKNTADFALKVMQKRLSLKQATKTCEMFRNIMLQN